MGQAVERVDAILIGYDRQENLGLRSILSYLSAHGRRALLVPFCPGNDASVLAVVQRSTPSLVGFSLIFQYSLDEFGTLMRFLRGHGVTAHFTAGGHFPSLRPEATLEALPELDSIVRFEGEETLLELLQNLEHPGEWNRIPGLAYRSGAATVISAPRPLIRNLDSLPLLSRDEPRQMGGGINAATMLASRGCLFDCAFCSIRQFYGSSPGALRRVRSPGAVVQEMLGLYTDKDIRFFSFQDDDFAARSLAQQEWVKTFLHELKRTGLSSNVGWKISCRVDDLCPAMLEEMMDHGLIAVYLGVESGNDEGLRTLNKRAGVEQNLAAISLLKEHDAAMSIGFMLFDPSSTQSTVRDNIRFLRSVGEDGYFPINFCKMLPYAGTPIEDSLRKDCRLKGTVSQPDYGFQDPRLDWYEFLVHRAFTRRNFDPGGLVALLQQADFDWRLTKYFGTGDPKPHFGEALNGIIRETNLLAIETLESLLDDILACGIDSLLEDRERLVSTFEREWRGEMVAEVNLKRLCATAPWIHQAPAEASSPPHE